eukprot:TRINITY_DN902_c0_g1_i1.p1 TRINITY_DN902_c0_g1~~TRINITY_DN902_c0_g1_i1.p1  ORF type:complete len:1245 (-),score=229.60 TRINITY_DN902_c0_g1_i1:90-3824(-)
MAGVVVLLLSLLLLVDADPFTSLRITEVMEASPSPNDVEVYARLKGRNFDFVEVMNIGTTPLNLLGVGLEDNVSFLMKKNMTLAPGACAVIVDKLEAFRLRYPTVPVASIMGEWDGNLKPNQPLALTYFGNIIHNFTIHDLWPGANKQGFTYVKNHPEGLLSSWDQINGWALSRPGGSPGLPNSGCAHAIFKSTAILITDSYLTVELELLSFASAPATIYYTVDGLLVPTTSSKKYTGPFNITTTTRVITRAYLSDGTPGYVNSHTYVFTKNLDSYRFSPEVGFTVIATFGQNTNQNNEMSYSVWIATFRPDHDKGGDKLSDALLDVETDAVMVVRGSSSGGVAKKQWRIRAVAFPGEEVVRRSVSMFGMPEDNGWILFGTSLFDNARCRNPVIYNFGRKEIGTSWASRTHPTEFYYLNAGNNVLDLDPTGKVYWGIYQMVERIKASGDRVDIEDLSTLDNAGDNVTGGYIWKIDRASPVVPDQFTAGPKNQKYIYHTPDQAIITTAQANYLKNYLSTWQTSLATITSEVNPTWLGMMDITTSIDKVFFEFIVKNVDGFRLSTYFHKPRGKPLAFAPMWDYDRTMNCGDDARCSAAGAWDMANVEHFYTDTSGVTWLKDLWSQPQWIRRYVNRWHELRSSGVLSYEALAKYVNKECGKVTPVFAKDVAKWGAARGNKTHAYEVQIILDFLKARLEYMDSSMCYNPADPFAKSPCDDNNPCTDDVCNPATCTKGPCIYPTNVKCLNIPNGCDAQCSALGSEGKACDDGSACTKDDKCVRGICKGVNACHDGIDCTKDKCVDGKCVHEVDDSQCGDGNPCTKNTCDAKLGCTYPARNCTLDKFETTCKCLQPSCSAPFGCKLSAVDALCDDKNVCTIDKCGLDTCCVHTPIAPCPDDAFACTTPVCDPIKGCGFTTNDAMCDDGIACTVDKCVVGVGCTNTVNNTACADAFSCTIDTCSKTKGCVHTPNNTVCKDAFDCSTDVCDVSKGCVYTANHALCDDKIPCSVDTCDLKKGCQHTANHAACDDKVGCTENKCDVATGCVFIPQNSTCDDKIDCTLDVCDIDLDCQYTLRDSLCEDGVACTVDTCDLTKGCLNEVDHAACDDTFECTTDICDLTEGCLYTTNDTLCDDNVNCTIDVCSLESGCVITPDHSVCANDLLCNYCNITEGCTQLLADTLCEEHNPCLEDWCTNLGCNVTIANDCKSNAGMIAGIVIGVVVAIVLAAIVIYFLTAGGAAADYDAYESL